MSLALLIVILCVYLLFIKYNNPPEELFKAVKQQVEFGVVRKGLAQINIRI